MILINAIDFWAKIDWSARCQLHWPDVFTMQFWSSDQHAPGWAKWLVIIDCGMISKALELCSRACQSPAKLIRNFVQVASKTGRRFAQMGQSPRSIARTSNLVVSRSVLYFPKKFFFVIIQLPQKKIKVYQLIVNMKSLQLCSGRQFWPETSFWALLLLQALLCKLYFASFAWNFVRTCMLETWRNSAMCPPTRLE